MQVPVEERLHIETLRLFMENAKVDFFPIKSRPSPFYGRICCQANISEFLEAAEGSE